MSEQTKPPEPPAPVTARPKKKRIVIAEDDKTLRDLLKIVLAEEGFEVIGCRDGRDAVQYLTLCRDNGNLPALIILDLNMPHVNGWEVAAWLDGDPALGDIPVIVISATEHHGRAAKMLNVDAYIVKPFTTDEILGVIALFMLMRY